MKERSESLDLTRVSVHPRCCRCEEPAKYVDSVPDKFVQGYNHNEAGYSLKYFCWLHAEERKLDAGATSRMRPIEDGGE